MADMKFFMANIVLIIGLAFGFASYGLADALDEDVDIGPGGEDFDTNRLSVQPDTDFIQRERDTMWVWDGTEGPEGEQYGYATYEIDSGGTGTNSTTAVAVDVDGPRIGLNTEMELRGLRSDADDPGVLLNERIMYLTDGENVVRDLDTRAETPYSQLEVRYAHGEDSTNGFVDIETIETTGEDPIIIEDREDSFVGPGELFDTRTAEIPRDDDRGLFSTITDTLNSAFTAVSQVPSILGAWISFLFAIPGPIGSAFRMYITGFFAYIVIVHIWIG